MLFFLSTALAGEVQVQASSPVVVTIDGEVLDFGDTMVASALDLAGGLHEVRVTTAGGELLAEKKVDVPVDHQVRLKYANRALRVTGEGQLPNMAKTEVVDLHAGVSPLGLSVNVSFDETEGRPPPVEPPLGPPQPMDAAAFTKLVAAVQGESFSSDQLDLVRSAATSHHFTCVQVAQLVELLSFGSDQVEVVRILRPRVVDPENSYVLNEQFTFSSDKEEVQALFQ
ncbi:MAG TPA: DUF4476 domain-containing protein [Myxococcota bacterium]|nr:DUF4476 domain-containing protein [Myxococcota bacterium]